MYNENQWKYLQNKALLPYMGKEGISHTNKKNPPAGYFGDQDLNNLQKDTGWQQQQLGWAAGERCM